MGHDLHKQTPFYKPRNPEASPFFRIVRERFDEFEKVYPERYEKKYGFWRSVIRSSIDKFLTAITTGCKPPRAAASMTAYMTLERTAAT
jgi:hypothetical protein